MSAGRKRSNYSMDSTDHSDCEDTRERTVKNFAKQMLKTSIFVGAYQERRYVEALKQYRDVIRIDADEVRLIENVKAVQKKVLTNLPHTLWTGISSEMIGAPDGYCLWVELPSMPLGKYWFKVRSVSLHRTEFRLKVEVVRPFREESPRRDVGDPTDFKQILEETCDSFKVHLRHFLTDVCTLKNSKEAITFLILFLGAAITGLFHLTHYLLEYLLRATRELSHLAKSISPVIITLINVTGRLIGATIVSILSLFYNGKGRPPYPYMMDNRPQIAYPYQRQRRQIPYRPTVEITEIN